MSRKIKNLPPSAGYDLYANFYDKKLAFLDSFEQFQLLPNLGNIIGKKILDVGAGTGRLSIRLAEKGAAVTAMDVSEEMLGVLNTKIKVKDEIPVPFATGKLELAGMTIAVADAENLPFPDNSFDIVIAAFLIVHLKNPKIFFNEAYRVLKPNGLLAITNINQKTPPELKTEKGKIIIESYYHRPEKIVSDLESLAFSIQKNILIKDKDVWINQIIIAEK